MLVPKNRRKLGPAEGETLEIVFVGFPGHPILFELPVCVAVDKFEHFTCIVFLIHMSSKTQYLIDLFVSNCIRSSSEDLISDLNSKGFDDPSSF